MGSEWKRCTIGDLCDAGIAELQTGPFGSQLHAHDYVSEGIPVVPTEAIGNRQILHSVLPKISPTKAKALARHRLKERDILFARRGVQATGHIAYVRELEEGFMCGTGAIRLRVSEDAGDLCPGFLSHVLANPASIAWFKFHAIGATMPNLNEGIIRSFPFCIPPLSEQRAIAQILGALDDKIELNAKMNRTLEAMARAIFKSWFVDFDPVRAKMEGRKPYGMDDAAAALFPDSFEESELGLVPKGWKTGAISDVGAVVCGKTPSTSVAEYYGSAVPFITIPDMRGRVFSVTTAKHLSIRGADSQPKKTLPAGSICVSCIATPGLVCITIEPSQTNQQINSVVPHEPDSAYYWYYALSDLEAEIVEGGGGGSVYANLSTSRFANLSVLIPDVSVVASYSELVSPLFTRYLSSERESSRLTETRDALLPKLISGQIRVKDAEKIVEGAI